MTTFLWSTWTRRDMTLLVASIALTAAGMATGNIWVVGASCLTFAGSIFCWGAGHVEAQYEYENCECDEVEA